MYDYNNITTTCDVPYEIKNINFEKIPINSEIKNNTLNTKNIQKLSLEIIKNNTKNKKSKLNSIITLSLNSVKLLKQKNKVKTKKQII